MRLDQERQRLIEPQRFQRALTTLADMGFKILSSEDHMIKFNHKGSPVLYYPYSGWHTGKTIRDGRGFHHLIRQLEADLAEAAQNSTQHETSD